MASSDALRQTIATMDGIQATLESLAVQTADPATKQSYLQATIDITESIIALRKQVDEIEAELRVR